MEPTFANIALLVEQERIRFTFLSEGRSHSISDGKKMRLAGRRALDEAARVEFSDEQYHRLIQAAQQLIEELPFHNDPREDWFAVHKTLQDAIEALGRIHIKGDLIHLLEQEAAEAKSLASSIPVQQKPATKSLGRSAKMRPEIKKFITSAQLVWRDAGGTGHGSWATKAPSRGTTIHKGPLQDLITVIFDALTELGTPVVVDGDTDRGFVQEVLNTISRSTIHQFLVSQRKA